jgi:phosphoribosylformylglycinamidine synthase
LYKKWDLHAVVIGVVTDTQNVVYRKDGEIKAEIPADSLVLGGGAPVYIRETKRPEYLDKKHSYDFSTLKHPTDFETVLKKLISSPNIASKRWIFNQYDSMVRTNTVQGPGPSDAAVIRLKGSNKALVMKVDCNGRYVYLNPRKGGMIAVAEAARNVVCAGGKPLAVTNNLNFGNPYKPEIYWVFKEAVGGMGDACRFFNTPVTGGNVSFYNENPKGAVFPTPTIGMLGLIDDVSKTITAKLKQDGDVVFYAGAPRKGFGGSEYLKVMFNLTEGDAPDIDLAFEKKLHETILSANDARLITAAHDCSDGGFAVAAAEMSIFSGHGMALDISKLGTGAETLFSEAQSGVVLTASHQHAVALEAHFQSAGVPIYRLGLVGGSVFNIEDHINIDVQELIDLYEGAIPSYMNQTVEIE